MEHQLSAPRKLIEDKFEVGNTYVKTNEGWIAQLENERLRSSSNKKIEQVAHGPSEKSYSKD